MANSTIPYHGNKQLDEINRDMIAEITIPRQKTYEIPREKGITPNSGIVNRILEAVPSQPVDGSGQMQKGGDIPLENNF